MSKTYVEFTDNSIAVKRELSAAVKKFLHEAGGEIKSQAVRNSRTDTGQTKNAFHYRTIDSAKETIVEIGGNYENLIWEEYGTGEYALHGDGRKAPWYVPVDGYKGHKRPTYKGKVVVVRGKNGKMFYKTDGKKPNKPLSRALDSVKPKLQVRLGVILAAALGGD